MRLHGRPSRLLAIADYTNDNFVRTPLFVLRSRHKTTVYPEILAIIKFGDFDPDRQTAKLKMSPIFPDIRYTMYCICKQIYICMYVRMYVCMQVYVHIVSWCGGELWVDQRKKCGGDCDVAQVTDIRTLPN